VGGGSVRPNLKEHRALQNELVTADWLRRYSSRSSVAGENQPEVFGLPHTDIEQFLADRCCHIAELARFQTRASMYGRMMVCHAAYFGARPKIGSCSLALLETFAESLQRGVKTDLEAIDRGLRHRKDAGGHPFNLVGLLTER